jgi:hypothetical protein
LKTQLIIFPQSLTRDHAAVARPYQAQAFGKFSSSIRALQTRLSTIPKTRVVSRAAEALFKSRRRP